MKVLAFLFVFSIKISNAANILYLSNVPSPSHFMWCKTVLQILHERGHNLTILSPNVENSRANLTYLHLDKIYPTLYSGSETIDFFEFSNLNPYDNFNHYADTSRKACIGSIESKGLRQLMEYPDTFKFDLVLHDFSVGQCLLVVLSKFGNINIVGVSPYNTPGLIGANLFYPSFVPGHDTSYTTKMMFLQRLYSAYVHILEYLFREYKVNPTDDKIVQKAYPNAPKLRNYEKNIKLYLINSFSLTDNKQPTFPIQINVGGAQIKEPKKLPDDLQEFADNAENGLVLFSLGTNVRSDSLNDEIKTKILNALARLNEYKFLWKFEAENKLSMELPKNVKIQSWIPQNDVLAHPNTKLFISHCGLMSAQEALWHGVPILGFPIFGDQPQNSLNLRELGVSKTLSILDFSEDQLYEAVRDLLVNPKYTKNVKKISKALRDRPMSALDEAVFWIEWILRNPDIDLQGSAADLNLFQRHSLDIYTFVIFIFVAIIHMTLMLLKYLIGIIFSEKTKGQKENKKKRN